MYAPAPGSCFDSTRLFFAKACETRTTHGRSFTGTLQTGRDHPMAKIQNSLPRRLRKSIKSTVCRTYLLNSVEPIGFYDDSILKDKMVIDCTEIARDSLSQDPGTRLHLGFNAQL